MKNKKKKEQQENQKNKINKERLINCKTLITNEKK